MKKQTDLEERILVGIHGLSVLEADKVLDTLRRLIWAKAFNGADLTVDKSNAMLEVARQLAEFPLADSASVLESVRMTIWQNAHPEARPCLFVDKPQDALTH